MLFNFVFLLISSIVINFAPKMILAQISLTNYKDARLKYGSLTYYDVLRLCQQTRSKHVAVSVLQDNMFQNEQQFP